MGGKKTRKSRAKKCLEDDSSCYESENDKCPGQSQAPGQNEETAGPSGTGAAHKKSEETSEVENPQFMPEEGRPPPPSSQDSGGAAAGVCRDQGAVSPAVDDRNQDTMSPVAHSNPGTESLVTKLDQPGGIPRAYRNQG